MNAQILNKDWIDSASYETLLARWRNAPVGDPMFTGETGAYYQKVMMQKRDRLSGVEASRASKSVGW